MQTSYDVQVLNFTLLRALEGAYTGADYAALLDAMDYGGTEGMSEAELHEMCVASLQDLDPPEAAVLLLRHKLSDHLRAGQLQNMAHEMDGEKLWEQYSDMSLHERLFAVGSLLYQAFPRVFPEPDAVRVQLAVTATSDEGRAILSEALLEPFVVRLLADGMPGAIIHRLLGDQLTGERFPEAGSIAWTLQHRPADGDTVHVDVISSGYWLDPLRNMRAYTSTAYPDPQ